MKQGKIQKKKDPESEQKQIEMIKSKKTLVQSVKIMMKLLYSAFYYGVQDYLYRSAGLS